MKEKIQQDIEKDIINIIKEEYGQEIDSVTFEIPARVEHGHLSTNVALKSAKTLKKAPQEIASNIASNITENKYISKFEVVNPGFINFYYSDIYFVLMLKEILKNGIKFDKIEKEINVEYVSANPTGALHLGHARNAIFGDSLANVLQKVGYNVTKEYYINDAGVQMQNLGKSVRYFYMQNFVDEPMFEDGYKGQEIKDIAQEIMEQFGDQKKDANLDFFIEYGYAYNMKEIKKILNDINVEFDVYSSEKYYHDNGLVKKAIDVLEEKGEVYVEEGAKWLRTTKYGDDKDRVLEKSDGTHTYLTSDIAYHNDKFKRTQGKLINIWGADHHGYIKRIEASMQSLGYKCEDLETIFIQMVSILENNAKVKMSKRAGTSVTIVDLLNLVDVDALRYFFVMRSPDTQLEFDIAKAHEENASNPIYYIQYAHARICSVLNKLEGVEIDYNFEKVKYTDEELLLIYKMGNYKECLLEAAEQKRPHLLANYVYELAAEFHKFYNNSQILVEDDDVKNSRVMLCIGVKQIIADCLNILGIIPKEKM